MKTYDFYRGFDSDIERRWMKASELRADGDAAKPVMRGNANTYGEYLLDWWGVREVLRPGAMTKTLAEKADVRALLNHNPDKVLGRTAAGTLAITDTDDGLYSEIYPDLEIGHAADTWRMIGRGDITQMSYAFRAVKERWTFFDDDEDPALRELLEIELFDVSPVTYPANPATDIGLGQRSLAHIAERADMGVGQAQRMLDRFSKRYDIDHNEPRTDGHSNEPGNHSTEPVKDEHSDDKQAVNYDAARGRLTIGQRLIIMGGRDANRD